MKRDCYGKNSMLERIRFYSEHATQGDVPMVQFSVKKEQTAICL